MTFRKKHTIYIDTKMDASQKSSNFNVKLNNWFVRNNIKNNELGNSEWYLSVKSLAMINSFSNITTGINDTFKLWIADTDSTPDLIEKQNFSDYHEKLIKIPPGNPNVSTLQTEINKQIDSFGLECVYVAYNSKFQFRHKALSTDNKKKYFVFKNTYDLLGFQKDKYYKIDNASASHKSFISERNVNLLSDRLIKFSIGNNSDIRIKDMSYCNSHSLFSDCSMFHLQPVNVNNYELIYYQRTTEDLIPIELLSNSIRNIEILVRNQDNAEVEELGEYIMVVDLIQVRKIDYTKKIYDVLKQIYLWLAMFLKNRI